MLQPILVYISKHNGNFDYSPISVNFLTETAKVFFAIFMLLIQVLSFSSFVLSMPLSFFFFFVGFGTPSLFFLNKFYSITEIVAIHCYFGCMGTNRKE